MVLANPSLIEADAIQMLDQIDIASQREGRVLIDRMKRSEKDSGTQAVGSNKCIHLILGGDFSVGDLRGRIWRHLVGLDRRRRWPLHDFTYRREKFGISAE